LTLMRRHKLLALLAALLLALAACGGDDGGDDLADIAADEADPGPEGDAGDVADDGSGDGGEVDEDALAALTNDDCAALYAGIASAASAFGGTEGEDLSDVATYFDEIADEVPGEIKDDFETFAAAYRQFAEAAEEAGIDFSDPATMTPEALQEMGTAAEAFNDPEVQEASERISTFAEETCGAGAGE
jgi:hypothetical protein